MVDILLMGNSYLYRGDTGIDGNSPADILERLTTAAGRDVNYTRADLGNSNFRDQWEKSQGVIPRDELSTGNYDIIIMGGADDGIATQRTDDDEAILADYGKRFVDLARANGTQAVFYEPWVPDFAVTPQQDNFTTAVSRLYERTASANDAGYAPNARAYKAAYDEFYQQLGPDNTGERVEDLLTYDGIHASPHGALLIASVVYGTIFGERAPFLRPSDVTAEEARALQDIAWSTVQRDAISLEDIDDTPAPSPAPSPPPPAPTPPVVDRTKGTDSDDDLQGTTGRDDMDGQGGNDSIDGQAGVDRVFGGAGSDALAFDNADTHYFGGTGEDTFVFNGGTSTLGMRISSVEVFDLENGRGDRLILQSDDVRQADGDLVIFADADDRIDLQTNQAVVQTGSETIGGQSYDRYEIGGSDELIFLIDADATLNVLAFA